MKPTVYLLPTKPFLHLLLSLLGLLSFSPLLAQNYNAGIGSGTGGNRNTFVGPYAGAITTTTGIENSFVGYAAGRLNTTGRGNSFVGYAAGRFNTTGPMNSSVGYGAGYRNTMGYGNSFVGYGAGWFNTTGNRNSFLGLRAGYENTTGSGNSFVGNEAGFFNTTGANNSFMGSEAGYQNTTGGSNSFVGYQAGQYNTTGSNNSFLGSYAGQSNTRGEHNSFLGALAGLSNTTGSNNLFLGHRADASTGDLSNAGANAYVSASNSLVLGAINGVNGATASTHVGIGTPAPAYLLHVNGVTAKPGGGAWAVASDARLKQNVSAFTDGLKVLTQIKPVWFEYNGKAGMPTNKTYVGVIAQEMQHMVGRFTYQDASGQQADYLDYDTNALLHHPTGRRRALGQYHHAARSGLPLPAAGRWPASGRQKAAPPALNRRLKASPRRLVFTQNLWKALANGQRFFRASFLG